MKLNRLVYAALLCPLLASGDTLIMKDGSRFVGRFISGNPQSINFTEANGNRQSLNMLDVQELRFGAEDAAYPPADGRQGFASGNNDFGATLDRLENDVRLALEGSNLPEDQRRSLRDSRLTLRRAMQVSQSGQIPDRAAVRLAFDNIRSAVNDPSVRENDRDRVLTDLERTRSLFPGMGDQRFGQGRNP